MIFSVSYGPDMDHLLGRYSNIRAECDGQGSQFPKQVQGRSASGMGISYNVLLVCKSAGTLVGCCSGGWNTGTLLYEVI